MILIVSDDEEPTTDLVIDWLLYYKQPFIRLSRDTPLRIEKIYHTSSGFECVFTFERFCERKTIDTQNITSYWYRRSNISVECPKIQFSDPIIQGQVAKYLHCEYQEGYKILNSILNRKKNINRYDDNEVIKIMYLEEAQKVGLDIPDSLICTSKNELLPFYQKHEGKVVTKTIGDPTALFLSGFRYYTSRVENLDDVPDTFGLTLFQEEVSKEVELRIFYLDSQFYPSAIFSQLDKQTEVDFKNYNSKRPNRVIPFYLNNTVQRKLRLLMKKLNLNSGSIDVILTPDGRYVFLEVNPVGQFEQVSFPCNYGLFKKVANRLK